jgi:hypothetical protein
MRGGAPTPYANLPNLPDITPDLSRGMPGAAAVAQLLALAGGNGYQLGDQQKIEFARAQARAEQQREQQRMQMEQERYVKGQEEQDFNRALQLVQAGVKPQDAFAAAPRTPGNRLPVLDAIYKQGQDAKKAAEEGAAQKTNRGGWSTGLPGLVAGPDDWARQQIAQWALATGRTEADLLRELDAAERLDAQKRADFEAEQARKDARAAARAAGSGGGLNPNQQALEADRLRRTVRIEGAKWDEPMSQATGALKAQEGVPAGDVEAQRIADSAMLYGFARLLSPVGVLSDEDVRRTLAQLPGALGSVQTINRVLSGSGVMTPGERKAMRKSLESRMAAIGETRRNTRRYVEKQAKIFQLDPTAILDPEGFGDVVSGGTSGASPPAAAAPPSEVEYRKARVRARQFLGREPSDAEIRDMLRIKLGQ